MFEVPIKTIMTFLFLTLEVNRKSVLSFPVTINQEITYQHQIEFETHFPHEY